MFEEMENFLFKYNFVLVPEEQFINFLVFLYRKFDPQMFRTSEFGKIRVVKFS